MIIDIIKSAEQKMQKSLEALKTCLSKIRTGRAHTGLLDHITVDYYGTHVPISQVANVGLADARTISIIPWEKNMLSPIEKTIRDSELGLNPVTIGEMIRVPMPALTEERRRDLTKIVKHEAEALLIELEDLYVACDLPEQPDRVEIDTLLCDVLWTHYSRMEMNCG